MTTARAKWPEAIPSDRLIVSDELPSSLCSTSDTNPMATRLYSVSDLEISSLCSNLSLDENGTNDILGNGCEKPRATFLLPTPLGPTDSDHVSPSTVLNQSPAEPTTMSTSPLVESTTQAFTSGFDAVKMRQKLSAEKDLLSSFKSPPRLPAEFATQNIASPENKTSCLKVKDTFRKVGRAAKRFLHQNIVKRRQYRLQRCEIHLIGLPDNTDQIIVTVSRHCTGRETHAIYFLPFLDNQVTLPKCLLPTNLKEDLAVTVYALQKEKDGDLKVFSKVIASGKCTVRADKTLVKLLLKMQYHSPSCAMVGKMHSRNMDTCSIEITHEPSSTYKFETKPKPVAIDFTELLVIQTADPFLEYFGLSSSTCEQPLQTTAYLLAGKYYAACSYRLIRGEWSGLSVIHSASLPVFFKSYLSKAEKTELLQAAQAKLDRNTKSLTVSQLFLARSPCFDVASFLQKCHSKQADTMMSLVSRIKLPRSQTEVDAEPLSASESLLFAVCDSKKEQGLQVPWSSGDCSGTVQIPPLTVFNINTRLYFADYWRCYGKDNVMLILCSKGSQAEEYCKQNLCKLDPYNNPFLFRKRVLFPEAQVQVYAVRDINLVILYSDSASIKQDIFYCTENLFFSKVQIKRWIDR